MHDVKNSAYMFIKPNNIYDIMSPINYHKQSRTGIHRKFLFIVIIIFGRMTKVLLHTCTWSIHWNYCVKGKLFPVST